MSKVISISAAHPRLQLAFRNENFEEDGELLTIEPAAGMALVELSSGKTTVAPLAVLDGVDIVPAEDIETFLGMLWQDDIESRTGFEEQAAAAIEKERKRSKKG